MAAKVKGAPTLTPRKKLDQQKEYRKRRKLEQEKGGARGITDVLLRAMVPAQEYETASTLGNPAVEVGTGLDLFFPGSGPKRPTLLQIAEEVLVTYQDGNGDPESDLEELSKLIRLGSLSKSSMELCPKTGERLFADDRAQLTACALLLLLSWVQRKRYEISAILMDYLPEKDGTGKTGRVKEALAEFLLDPESYTQISKKVSEGYNP